MIFALLGLALFAYAYVNSKERQDSSGLAMWVSILMGAAFISADFYSSIVLPWQISQMYNGGAGIAYGNSTYFNGSDLSIAYFMAQTKNEWLAMEIVKYSGVALGAVFILVFLWQAMSQGTLASWESFVKGRKR